MDIVDVVDTVDDVDKGTGNRPVVFRFMSPFLMMASRGLGLFPKYAKIDGGRAVR